MAAQESFPLYVGTQENRKVLALEVPGHLVPWTGWLLGSILSWWPEQLKTRRQLGRSQTVGERTTTLHWSRLHCIEEVLHVLPFATS